MRNKTLGDKGEIKAISFLQNLGHKIIDLNIRIGSGEIDIVSIYNDVYNFTEVKTRLNNNYGELEETVTKSKYNKFINSVFIYCSDNNLNEDDIKINFILIDKDRLEFIENPDFY